MPPARFPFASDESWVEIDGTRVYRPVRADWRFKPVNRVLFVSPRGHDSANGSTYKPFQTIGRGVLAAGPGDLIYVLSGTYRETIRFHKSGMPGKPIVLSCAPGALGRVIVTPPPGYVPGQAVCTFHNVEFVVVNGLAFLGHKGRPEAPAEEHFGANGVTFQNGAGDGCYVQNCLIADCLHCGIKEMGHGGFGIEASANVVWNCGTNGLDHGVYFPCNASVIRGNVLWRNVGWGVHAYADPSNLTVSRNVCWANGGGVLMAGRGCRVWHNTVYANRNEGMMYFRATCRDNQVGNNLFIGNRDDCGYDNGGGLLGDPAGSTDDRNDYWPGAVDPLLAVNNRVGPHNVSVDPGFNDAKAGDFRLRDSSPVRGIGADVGEGMGRRPNLGAFA